MWEDATWTQPLEAVLRFIGSTAFSLLRMTLRLSSPHQGNFHLNEASFQTPSQAPSFLLSPQLSSSDGWSTNQLSRIYFISQPHSLAFRIIKPSKSLHSSNKQLAPCSIVVTFSPLDPTAFLLSINNNLAVPFEVSKAAVPS